MAHRLGLIPLNADPALFDFKTRKAAYLLVLSYLIVTQPLSTSKVRPYALHCSAHLAAGEETASEKNTFVLRLQVTCKRQGTQMINDRGKPHHFADPHRLGPLLAATPNIHHWSHHVCK